LKYDFISRRKIFAGWKKRDGRKFIPSDHNLADDLNRTHSGARCCAELSENTLGSNALKRGRAIHPAPFFIRTGISGKWLSKCLNRRVPHERNFVKTFPTGDKMKSRVAVLVLISGLGLVSRADDKPKVVVPAPSNEYALGPEDVIEVFVWKEPDLSTTVTVRPDGKISLPLANELEASGKTAGQLQQEIAERLQKYIVKPVVNVMVKQINSLKISVLGEVRKPDVYKIKNRITVLDAVAMAGGFTDLAKPNRVIVLRNEDATQKRYVVNVNQVVGEKSVAPFYLQAMDTVYVEGR
jgi:polysaccharide export outer membrane protein